MKISLSLILFLIFITISAQNGYDKNIYAKDKIEISFRKIKDLGEDIPNYHLTVIKNKKNIFEDSVYSKVGEIKFEDFNGDGIKDILIQNSSDVRSNWTYFLYLYDTKSKNFRKIKDFETIKNPEYNNDYKLIESHVISGRDYTAFYKIHENTIIDLQEIVYDDHSENDDNGYQKALEKLSK